MSSKVIVEIIFLTITVLFTTGFAQIDNADGSNTESRSDDIRTRPHDFLNNRDNPGSTPNDDNVNPFHGPVRHRTAIADVCGGSGWERIISVDASSGECPNNFRLDLAGSGIRVCRGDIRAPGSNRSRIHRATFSIDSHVSFTKVAGFVEGHQFGSPDAFSGRNTFGGMDGITFSYGNSSSQYFLWAYAAGVADKKDRADCPCSTVPGDAAPSKFGSYYYCDTGNPGNSSQNRWFTEKVLWSEEGCPATSTCCNDPNLPYFCRTDLDVQKTRNADRFVVTMRFSDAAASEDIGITKLEIYVAELINDDQLIP